MWTTVALPISGPRWERHRQSAPHQKHFGDPVYWPMAQAAGRVAQQAIAFAGTDVATPGGRDLHSKIAIATFPQLREQEAVPRRSSVGATPTVHPQSNPRSRATDAFPQSLVNRGFRQAVGLVEIDDPARVRRVQQLAHRRPSPVCIPCPLGPAQALHACFPSIRLVWADSGYAGQLVAWSIQQLRLTVQIVAKLAGQTTFVVLHRRWAVERPFPGSTAAAEPCVTTNDFRSTTRRWSNRP